MPLAKDDRSERPSPEALLAQAKREAAGHLKIFVGAAPGVGKTWEMLQEARAKLLEGVDVVIGIVETHGRKETEVLTEGIETLPRRIVAYSGRALDEFDLDAALKRRPSLILVDELAHTNVHGSRHPKRYQDVEELLAAGIDVYTTVNIQHIESLNDVVAQITRVRVREIVPDSLIDKANAIELVDLTPDDLIKRLKEGKVYLPRQAERALRHYFSPANLTALRELALRRTAERVDEQLLEQLQAKAITGSWAAGERFLVCISEDPQSAILVRRAKRLADRLHAPWTAVYVEGPRNFELKETDKSRLVETTRLAERLGAEMVTLSAKAPTIADDILDYAHRNNYTQIIVARSHSSWWSRFIHGSIVHDLIHKSEDIGIHVLAGDLPPERKSTPIRTAPAKGLPLSPISYAIATASVALALGVCIALFPLIGLENVDLVFLTAIVGVAVWQGLGPSLLASILSSLSYNYFFLPPIYTFTISDPTNVAAFVIFALLSVVISNLAARGRIYSVAAQERVRSVEQLHAFSRKLASAGTLDDVLWATVYQIASMLRVNVVLLLPEDGTIALKAGYPPEDHLEAADLAAATWAWEKERPAGRDSDTLPGAEWLFIPMRTSRGLIGILGITREAQGPLVRADQRRLLDALADQGALAIERAQLVGRVEQDRRTAETEQLRTALLTSISHDLKTPLASILGSAGTLRDLSGKLDENEKQELTETIIEESERLNRFIANLLDMTKLESGAVAPNLAAYEVSEIIGTALSRASKIMAAHTLEVEIGNGNPTVLVDPVLLEQALFNLLDNAAKYSERGTKIRIQSWRDNEWIQIQVLDEGPGIPSDELTYIFDKFYRVRKSDSVRAGTGLGLAISKGFIEGMHGRIVAANRTDRPGAIFSIMLPAQEPNDQELTP